MLCYISECISNNCIRISLMCKIWLPFSTCITIPYPASIFCSENVAWLLCPLHLFKCTPEYFCHRSKHYGPGQDCSLRSSLIWDRMVCNIGYQSTLADDNCCEWQVKGFTEYSNTCTNIQRHEQIIKYIYKYLNTCSNIQIHDQIFKYMYKYSKTCTNIQVHV